MRRAEIDLRVHLQARAIRNPCAAIWGRHAGRQVTSRAQAGTVEEIRAQPRVIPEVRHPTRGGMFLLMVKVNVVVCNIGKIFRSEVELRGVDFLAFGGLCREVEIDRQISGRVIAREFDAVLLTVAVVEGRQYDLRPELTLVDEV